MKAQYIASVDLIAAQASGARTPVTFRVGAPEQTVTGEWRCTICLDGLHDQLIPVHGEDSVQALWPLEAHFGWLGSLHPPAA